MRAAVGDDDGPSELVLDFLRVDRYTSGKDQYMLKLMYATDSALWQIVEIP